MPEYLAPGVFVEEVSFRSKSIEGVSTTTTGFIGPTRFGPVTDTPEVITSVGAFERALGDGQQLSFGTSGRRADNYLWHAARSFFEAEGKRLYVSRLFRPLHGSYPTDLAAKDPAQTTNPLYDDGHGRKNVGDDGKGFRVVARHPGAAGNFRLQFSLSLGPNVLGALPDDPNDPSKLSATLRNLRDGDVVWVRSSKHFPDDLAFADVVPPAQLASQLPLFVARKVNGKWSFKGAGLAPATTQLGGAAHTALAAKVSAEVKLQRAELEVTSTEKAAKDTATVLAAATSKDTEAKAKVTTATAAATAAANDLTAKTTAAGQPNAPPSALVALEEAKKVDADAKAALATAKDEAATAATALTKASSDDSAARTAKTTAANARATAKTARDNAATAAATAIAAASATPVDLALSDLQLSSTPGEGDVVRPVALGIEVLSADGSQSLFSRRDLPLDPVHVTDGVPDSIFDLLPAGARGRGTPTILFNAGLTTGDQLLAALDTLDSGIAISAKEWSSAPNKSLLAVIERALERGVSRNTALGGGNDGEMPGVTEYEGSADPELDYRTGFKQLEDLEDISIVAAPGSNWDYDNRVDDANAITNLLMTHATAMKYRIAIVDPPMGRSIADVRKLRAKLDSKHAALYYPWVTVVDPITRKVIELPPSGFVAGIYARNDVERGVWKAPANEVVRGAIGFETLINTAQQEVLNPEGINCFRSFEGRGLRLWGARTLSSDPEWKYVNLRRYFAYLERSVDKGTQWAVFEPNGEALWANVRATIRDFLVNEWANGALLGEKPEKAFFVRCDRSTMTQNDLDNGRLVCLVGVAPLKPAEFVIFRIGQWTADQKN